MAKLLYYPYISIEKTPWLYKTILYCDSLSTITPIEFLEDPNNFDEHMRILLSEGFVKPLIPLSEIGNPMIFETNFIRNIKRNYTNLNTSGKQKSHSSQIILNNVNLEYKQIHFDKVSKNIKDFLIENGFAKTGTNNQLYVRKDIARDYMYYLASTIGNISDYSITTDSEENFSPLHHKYRIQRRQHTPRIENSREYLIKAHLLEGIFSIPQEIENFGDILRCKQKNEDLLKNFQGLVEAIISEVKTLPPEFEHQWIEEKIKELTEEKTILKEKWKKLG